MTRKCGVMRNDQPRPTTSHWADSTDRAGGNHRTGNREGGIGEMDCIFCGEWFVSSGDSTICPPCERAMKRLGIKMSPDRLRQLVQAEKDGRIVLLPCKQGDTL